MSIIVVDVENDGLMRKTNHTHNSVYDATGNAEVLSYMKNEMGLKMGLS